MFKKILSAVAERLFKRVDNKAIASLVGSLVVSGLTWLATRYGLDLPPELVDEIGVTVAALTQPVAQAGIQYLITWLWPANAPPPSPTTTETLS